MADNRGEYFIPTVKKIYTPQEHEAEWDCATGIECFPYEMFMYTDQA